MAVWIWALGILVFLGIALSPRGDQYPLACAITPIGGLLFLAGWLLVTIKPQ